MSSPSDPSAGVPATGTSAAATGAASAAVAASIEIAQTCTLAGRPDLIAGFLEAGISPTAVRSQLLAAQAQASPEITSRIDPNTAVAAPQASSNPANNPLIQAVKSRIAAAQGHQPTSR